MASKVFRIYQNRSKDPVVVSDQFATDGDAIVANRQGFVIPRLGGMNIETDYEVANQRTAIVTSQTVGFDSIIANVASRHVVPA